MNIAEILKDCPKGTRLYSPIFGELNFEFVREDARFPIICTAIDGAVPLFTCDGRYLDGYTNAECTLFPSRDQRDWNKFGLTDQETKTQLKPFDKVLVRINDKCDWVCNIFSHMDSDNEYVCLYMRWPLCIPYEGNEHLLGTNNKPE
jgi:hypothetical protein|nr:MAG TPA_asm: hypothetical protein [Caudoviricetes sp.]